MFDLQYIATFRLFTVKLFHVPDIMNFTHDANNRKNRLSN
jgi:hypothetical protein